MKKLLFTILICIYSIIGLCQNYHAPLSDSKQDQMSKKIYTTCNNELSFQFANAEIQGNSDDITECCRVSYLLNIPYIIHINCTNYFGLMPSVHLKSLGLQTKNEIIDTVTFDKVKRCLYTAGASFALKFGLFKKHLWAYTGASMDWVYLYRQKKYEDNKNHRITKERAWFSKATEQFLPSFFAGMQFPEGINLKVTYYFKDLLNHNYNGSLGDFTKFNKSNLLTFSISLTIQDLYKKSKKAVDNTTLEANENILFEF